MAADLLVYSVRPAAVNTMAPANGNAHGECSTSPFFDTGDGVDDDMMLLVASDIKL